METNSVPARILKAMYHLMNDSVETDENEEEEEVQRPKSTKSNMGVTGGGVRGTPKYYLMVYICCQTGFSRWADPCSLEEH